MTSSDPALIHQADFERRIIEPCDFIADTEAFVDVRIARSRGKASYSFIGPGVSQNADQNINLTEPHGFNLGAATMPHGVVNNPHLHYTAEVFVCTRGTYRMTIGRHGEQSIDLGPGDVFAAPTWTFRGFENTGPDDGWLFVALGGDDTGGIIWSPDVLREAAETGLYLGHDNSLVDTATGAQPIDVVTPLDDDMLGAVDVYTDAELEAMVVRSTDRDWSTYGLLSSVLDGHASRIAPVLGHGISQDRRHRAPIMTAQGFSLDWLEIEPGCSTGVHRIAETQALMIIDGEWQISCNQGADRLDAKPATGSVVSVPPSVWRDFTNVGTCTALAAVISGTDSPNLIQWSAEVADQARSRGFVLDAAGKVAPLGLLPAGTT